MATCQDAMNDNDQLGVRTPKPVRPRFVPPPYQDAPESGRLILRDGSTAQVQLARREDEEELLGFFRRLSPESRRRRFLATGMPQPKLIAFLCDTSNPSRVLTLVVRRAAEGRSHIVATGSYV